MKTALISAAHALTFVPLFVVLGHPGLAHARIPQSERQALIALFNSTQGESWKSTDGWLSLQGKLGDPGTECEWEGVTCDDDNGHVTGLALSDFGLRGVLPPNVSNLRELKTLDLSFNRLEGVLPNGLFSLKHLERLDLSQNRFQGLLPVNTTVLRKLESLRLGGNYLHGSIGGMARFPGLVELDLSDNRFQGSLPSSIRFLARLEMLSLHRNALTGKLPAEIEGLHSLKGLSLGHNHFTGEVPAQIGKLSKLELVDLSFNNFAGPLPPTLRHLENLKTLIASHNSLEGHFPISICQDSMFELDLSANQFDGEFPSDMSRCSSVRTLTLADNAFRGNLSPAFFSTMADLQYLDLSSNHLSGPLPSSLGDSTKLSALNLSDNELSGEISHIEWPNLGALRMDRNKFSGPIPKGLLSDSLRELTISSNRFSGELPEGLCALVSLRIIDLSHNQFTGPLCERIGDLRNINILNVSNNQLNGTLPTSIGTLPKLTSLLLSHNLFTGPLPQEANLPALQFLDISFNRLTGELPEWVGNLAILRSADLSNNAFSGGLSHLARVKRLRHLDISGNNWSEAPPERLINLQNAPASTTPAPIIDPRAVEADENTESPGEKTSITVKEEPLRDVVGPVLSGSVQDPTGASVVNARVTATDLSTSVKMDTTTDENGHFGFSVPEGAYRLTVEVKGFKSRSTDLTVKSNTAYRLNVPIELGSTFEMVEVSASVPQTRQGLWWNSWITRRGAAEDSKTTVLTSKQKRYSFYLELSGVPKRNQENGDFSVELDQELQKHLADLLTQDTGLTALFVRVSVIGRAVVLSTDVSSVAQWSSAGWSQTNGSTSSAVLNVELSNLFPSLPPATGDTAKPGGPSFVHRGGALRFGIDAVERGCAVVAVSIWDDTRSVPLDHLVRALSVDGQTGCSLEIDEQKTGPSLYSGASRGIKPDVSLQVFEFNLNGETHSASFMALKSPTEQQEGKDQPDTTDRSSQLEQQGSRGQQDRCEESYSWDSDATLTELVLKNTSFKGDLVKARMTDHLYDTVYSSLGEQITNAVFSSSRSAGTCGATEALEALKALARDKDVRMFARLSDENGRLAIAPLGLMAMFEQGGQRVFQHDIRLFQPIARETLSHTECVSGWTFVLPSRLEGVNDETVLKPPTSLASDTRVIRSREEFIQEFVSVSPDNDNPSGLLLLAHHEDGVLRFSGAGDTMLYTEFKRDLGLGSIVVLSACETANLTQSTKLVGRLNQKGADALVVALFDLPADFGIKFSFNFALVVAKKENLPITLEDAFNKALSDTVKEFTKTRGDRARGMGLELVLAGNPKLQICTVNEASIQDANPSQ